MPVDELRTCPQRGRQAKMEAANQRDIKSSRLPYRVIQYLPKLLLLEELRFLQQATALRKLPEPDRQKQRVSHLLPSWREVALEGKFRAGSHLRLQPTL